MLQSNYNNINFCFAFFEWRMRKFILFINLETAVKFFFPNRLYALQKLVHILFFALSVLGFSTLLKLIRGRQFTNSY